MNLSHELGSFTDPNKAGSVLVFIRVYSCPFVVEKGCVMLQPIKAKKFKSAGGHFAIVASEYNARYVNAMLQAAKTELVRAGAETVHVTRVPGAFEIPVVTARLARLAAPRLSAIICLGVILRGETTHAQHIGEAVTTALVQLQLEYEIPVIHEVLLLENEAQAQARCRGGKFNRGVEAARTALKMAKVMNRLASQH